MVKIRLEKTPKHLSDVLYWIYFIQHKKIIKTFPLKLAIYIFITIEFKLRLLTRRNPWLRVQKVAYYRIFVLQIFFYPFNIVWYPRVQIHFFSIAGTKAITWYQKYSKLRYLLLVKGLVVCFYLGWSGSILQIRMDNNKVRFKVMAKYLLAAVI